MERLQELLDNPLVQSRKQTLSTSFKVSFQGDQQAVVGFDGYSDTDFRAFFTTFRQFSMPTEEAVYVKDVAQIILDNCDREELEAWVSLASQHWDRIMEDHPVIQFELQGKHYKNKDLLKLWLYGGRFHTDIAKADTWSSLPEPAQKDFELSVQAMTHSLLNCLVIVGSVIHWWLDAPGEVVPQAPTS